MLNFTRLPNYILFISTLNGKKSPRLLKKIYLFAYIFPVDVWHSMKK